MRIDKKLNEILIPTPHSRVLKMVIKFILAIGYNIRKETVDGGGLSYDL